MLTVMAVTIGLAMAGCGGGGSDSAPVSKAEFVKQANAVCEELQKRVKADLQDYEKSLHGRRPQGAELASVRTKVAETVLIPVKQQEAEELGDLGAPSGEEDRVDAIVVALEKGVDEAENDPKLAVVNSGKIFAEAGELAAKYGLNGC